MKTLLLSVILAGFALASPEMKAVHSAPEGVDLVKFPILQDGGLTAEKTADLGLVSFRLKESVKVLNHYRNNNTWTHDTLVKGDTVYKDNVTGEILYRAYCSNRVMVVKNCLAQPMVLQAVPAPKKELGWFDNAVEKFADGWRKSSAATGWGFGAILAPLCLLGLLGLLALGGRSLFNMIRPPAPPAPPTTPEPPATPAVTPGYRRGPSTLINPPPTPLGRNQRM